MPRRYGTGRDHLDDIIALGRCVFERRQASEPVRAAELALEIVERSEQIEASLELARITGAQLPLDRLRVAFGLEPAELRCLYVLLALAVSSEVRTIARSDGTATLEELDQLVYSGGPGRERFADHLGTDGNLFGYGLIEYEDESRGRFARPVRIADRMVELAYGRDRAASELAGFATLADACASDLLVPDDARRSTLVALQRHVDTGGGPVPVLRGPEGSGRRALISTLAHELGARVLVVRCGALPERLGPALTAITREATLAGAVIVIADAELLAADPGTGRPDRTGALHAAFTGYAGPLAITMAHEASPANLMPLRAVGARTVVFMRPSVTNVSHTTSWSLRAAISAHWMETDTWSVWTSAAMTESPRVTKPH